MHTPLRLACQLSIWILLTALAGAAPLSSSANVANASTEGGRVIVLGFDGADSRHVARMMEAGELPNLARLAEKGTFAPLRSTNPAESAAGWAALNTGLQPAKNGVPSFFGRDFFEGGSFDGQPRANAFHMRTESRSTEEMEIPGLLGFLAGKSPMTLAAMGGLAVFVIFLLVFLGLLRTKGPLGVLLALILGAVGAWGAHRCAGYAPAEIPKVTRNLIEADGFWKPAAEHGVRSIVLDAALAFDRPSVEGARVLAGLGLPDARGDIGEWFVYTTKETEFGLWPEGSDSGTGSGQIFKVSWQENRIEAKVPGPLRFGSQEPLESELASIEKQKADPNIGWKKSRELNTRQAEIEDVLEAYNKGGNEARVTVDLAIEKLDDGRVRVTMGGTSHEIAEREWSGWFPLEFGINPLLSAHAVTRVSVLSMDDPFTLFVSTLDIDPSHPHFWQPISQPQGFAGEIAEWIGEPYETVGWACLTNQIKDKELPIDTFLQDIEFTMGWREAMTYSALARDDWEILFSVFSTPDRVQHMTYKYADSKHPLHEPEEAAREIDYFGKTTRLADVIDETYRQVDRVVGKVMDEFMRPEDTLMLCADHGFTSFRRQVDVNNFLAENGWLVLKDDLNSTRRRMLANSVDWSRTQAYALGLGMVFVNLKGREPLGIVEPSDARALLEQIRDKALELQDPEGIDGPTPAIRDVVISEDAFEGPFADRCSDLMLGFEEYYRVAWDTAGGKLDLREADTDSGGIEILPDAIFEDNTNNWCGDHASVSPHIVTGIFFSSRPVVVPEAGVEVTHIAPTVLDLAGVPIPADYDQAPLARP